MKSMKTLFLAVAVLAVTAVSALAQVPTTNPPYNVPLGAVVTLTGAINATTNSSDQNNLAGAGVICTYDLTAHSGTPSTTMAIQMKDSASSTYQTLAISGAITALNTPTSVVVYPGIQTSTLPTGMVAINLKLPRTWRVQLVQTGSATPTATATVGCDTLR